MTNYLTIDKIIEFYDVPQIITAKDIFGTRFLCVLYNDEPTCKYTGVKISDARLSQFISGKIDLRSIFTNSEDDTFFDMCMENQKLKCEELPSRQLDESKLPAPNFYHESDKLEKITLEVPISDKPLFTEIISRFGWATA